MQLKNKLVAILAAVVWTASLNAADPPLAVSGVADKTIYQDQVTFFITRDTGFDYDARLDGEPVPVGTNVTITVMDYHELAVWRTNLTTTATSNVLIRFVIIESERVGTEEGIAKWIPTPPIPSAPGEFAGADIHLMIPPSFPTGIEVPVVAWVRRPDGTVPRVNGVLEIPGQTTFTIFRGAGSGFLPASYMGGTQTFNALLSGLSANINIQFESGVNWTRVGGTLSGSITWPANSRIYITNTLTLATGATLTVGSGTIILVAPGVDIYVDGQLFFNGLTNAPIVVTPQSRNMPWGGFMIRGTAQFNATATIFTGSGADPCWYAQHQSDRCGTPNRPSSHRPEQSLFHTTNTPTLNLADCAAIYLKGQFGHAIHAATFNINRTLVQRCISGGQYDNGSIIMRDSVVVEVPEASDFWVDGDNDAFYLSKGGHAFTNCVIGWTKDDLMDSGGGGSGTNYFINCWFENPLHEGVAGSGSGKYNFIRGTVAVNCGQGFEAGYDRVTNFVDHCFASGNIVGVRMADNYYSGFTHNGFVLCTNSIVLYNHRNLWAMEYNSTGWTNMINNMDARGNFLSEPNPVWPANTVWNPDTDAWRLLDFMTIPPQSHVGIGFGTWTNLLAINALSDGIPVCLSHFTTNTVSVDFAIQANGAPLTNGTLIFPPGRLSQRLQLPASLTTGISTLTATLVNPANSELTGLSSITYRIPPVLVNLSASGLMDVGALTTGVQILLSKTSAVPVQVDFQFINSTGVLTNGTLTFAPGQTSRLLTLPTINPESLQLGRLELRTPQAAELGTSNQVYFAPIPFGGNVVLVATNSWWYYLDMVTNADTSWRGTNFDHSSWSYGQAQLGFGDGDEVTRIRSNTVQNISYYFRQQFMVSDPAVFTNLVLWLLRDDGGVVYLNGREVFRSANMPAAPTVITYTTLANVTNSAENTIDIVNISPTNLVRGINLVAVEIHQQATTSSDISFNLAITGQAPQPPLRLHFSRLNSKPILFSTDPSAQLWEAPEALGPWQPSINPGNPAEITPTAPRKFYRLGKP